MIIAALTFDINSYTLALQILTIDPISFKMSEKKILEAEEHIRLAAKALKTSFLKWSPDYDTAGDEYSRAATAFKVRLFFC